MRQADRKYTYLSDRNSGSLCGDYFLFIAFLRIWESRTVHSYRGVARVPPTNDKVTEGGKNHAGGWAKDVLSSGLTDRSVDQ